MEMNIIPWSPVLRYATPLPMNRTPVSTVGGPKQCVLGSMVTGGKGHNVYPGSGPLDGGKTLRPA